MKKIILPFAFTLITGMSFCQDISDISQSGNLLTVRDERNNEISRRYINSEDELSGFSSTIVVIRSGNLVYVFDQKFNEISRRYINSDDKVKNVNGNNIIIKAGNLITTYDKNWSEISRRYE